MATKLENGTWRAQVLISPPGAPRKYKSFYGATEDEANYKALDFKHAKKTQYERKPENMTLKEAVTEYIELRRPILSPSTIRGYEKIRDNNLGELSNAKLFAIDYSMLQKAVNKLCSDHSVKTVKNALGLINPVLRLFAGKEIKDITLPRAKKVEYNTPDGATLRKIFASASGTPLEVPILLSAWLSLRMSEILGLRWEDVKEDHIQINKALIYDGYEMIEKEPKTEMSRRKIICSQYLLDKINSLPRTGERVFHGWTTNKMSKMYARLLKENDLPHSRFHDLRHANASAMLMLGVPDKYAMERGGWSNLSTMRDRYQQTFNEEQRAVANRIDDYFLSLLQPNVQQ